MNTNARKPLMQIMLISKLFSISDGNCCIHYFSLLFFSSISQNQWKWNVHWTQWKGPSRTRAQCVFSLRVQKSLQKPLQVPLLTAIIQQSYWHFNNFSAKVLLITQTALGFSATGIWIPKNSCCSTRYYQKLVWKP